VDTLTLWRIGLAVVAVVAVLIWVSKTKKNFLASSLRSTAHEFDEVHQVIIDSAQRLLDVINESLKIANESKNADTKVSRLDVAKQRLVDLKRLSKEHPFIKLTQLPQAPTMGDITFSKY